MSYSLVSLMRRYKEKKDLVAKRKRKRMNRRLQRAVNLSYKLDPTYEFFKPLTGQLFDWCDGTIEVCSVVHENTAFVIIKVDEDEVNTCASLCVARTWLLPFYWVGYCYRSEKTWGYVKGKVQGRFLSRKRAHNCAAKLLADDINYEFKGEVK